MDGIQWVKVPSVIVVEIYSQAKSDEANKAGLKLISVKDGMDYLLDDYQSMLSTVYGEKYLLMLKKKILKRVFHLKIR